jgi:hypothetical protein
MNIENTERQEVSLASDIEKRSKGTADETKAKEAKPEEPDTECSTGTPFPAWTEESVRAEIERMRNQPRKTSEEYRLLMYEGIPLLSPSKRT